MDSFVDFCVGSFVDFCVDFGHASCEFEKWNFRLLLSLYAILQHYLLPIIKMLVQEMDVGRGK